MHIDFTPEQKALREELRAYYADLFSTDLRARLDEEWDELGGPAFREAMGRMGKDVVALTVAPDRQHDGVQCAFHASPNVSPLATPASAAHSEAATLPPPAGRTRLIWTRPPMH